MAPMFAVLIEKKKKRKQRFVLGHEFTLMPIHQGLYIWSFILFYTRLAPESISRIAEQRTRQNTRDLKPACACEESEPEWLVIFPILRTSADLAQSP